MCQTSISATKLVLCQCLIGDGVSNVNVYYESFHICQICWKFCLFVGVLYHRWDKKDKARQMYKKALEIDSNLKSAELNLKRLTAKAQQ